MAEKEPIDESCGSVWVKFIGRYWSGDGAGSENQLLGFVYSADADGEWFDYSCQYYEYGCIYHFVLDFDNGTIFSVEEVGDATK